jgi:hypothetical protein
MNDDRTEEQKQQALENAKEIAIRYGWSHVNEWIFQSPSGSKHDLSAADMSMLEYIEDNKVFLV